MNVIRKGERGPRNEFTRHQWWSRRSVRKRQGRNSSRVSKPTGADSPTCLRLLQAGPGPRQGTGAETAGQPVKLSAEADLGVQDGKVQSPESQVIWANKPNKLGSQIFQQTYMWFFFFFFLLCLLPDVNGSGSLSKYLLLRESACTADALISWLESRRTARTPSGSQHQVGKKPRRVWERRFMWIVSSLS